MRKLVHAIGLNDVCDSFLPRFAIIDTVRDNDAKRTREICAGSPRKFKFSIGCQGSD
jgi:hypothetical protein